MTAEVTHYGIFNMQVCVPTDWTDDQVLAFAEGAFPCGTTNGWIIRREGDPLAKGDPERVQCASRTGHVHIVLDA